uniref:Uncharacterized protein n=1 Tax=Anguilla anguilla TaxID=7936 RepID=A0A0E9RJT5_ANGAN
MLSRISYSDTSLMATCITFPLKFEYNL